MKAREVSKSATGRAIALKTRLGIGAAILGTGTLLTAIILYLGMQMVAERLDTALAAETRMSRYAALSTQAATFIVVATEAVQTGQPPDVRRQRIEPVIGQLRRTFEGLRKGVQEAVVSAGDLGIDVQSRYGTQSLGLARMEALLDQTVNGLSENVQDTDRLRAFIDSFATGVDPLLSEAVNSERLFRNATLAGIQDVRERLTLTAVVIALLTVASALWFYFGLIRPQFGRLDRLRLAAQQIGEADFAVALPEERQDEIGALYAQTNRMAEALSDRQSAVETEWTQLNQTIEARTQDLRNANEKLAEIDENRRRFFADVSHELRTPLTVILMEAQIGQQGGTEAQSAFATIEQSAAGLNRRIDDLLRVARSDSGQLAMDPQTVALTELIFAATAEVRAELDAAEMVLHCDTIPELSLHCDPNWVRQVLVSLIRNAIRHARDGREVELSVRADKDDAALAVTDNGPGVTPEDQVRLFERFEQTGAAKSQGFGVGLALAKWVIEAQGGQIDLISPIPPEVALGKNPGTQVLLRLPLAKDTE